MNGQTEILELEITQEDIDKAIQLSSEPFHDICHTCVVSVAAKRAGVEGFHQSADGALFGVYDETNNALRMWEGGQEAKEVMETFDRNFKRFPYNIKPTKLIFTKVDNS